MGRFRHNSPHPRWRQGLLLLASLAGLAHLRADVTDPFGYFSHSIPAQSRRLIGVPLLGDPSFYGTVTEVLPSGLRIHTDDTWHPPVMGNSATACVAVRAGLHAGLTVSATAYADDVLTLLNPPGGMFATGDTIQIFPDHTLGSLFGVENQIGLMAGASAAEADTIGVWNAATQSSRVFYYQSESGWREAGKEAEGDRVNATVSFPGAIVINRRADAPLTFTLLGAVPMPMEQRLVPVSHGRNLISAPFSMAPKVSDYELYVPGSPFSVIAAASAPEADTIRFTNFSTATESEVIYSQLGAGWRVVGTSGDAGETPVELGQAMDLQRVGPAGYIKARGISEQPAAARALMTAPDDVIPIKRRLPAEGGVRLEWDASAGHSYKVQVQPLGQSGWQDLVAPVLATSGTGSVVCKPSGQGQIRIVKLQG